MGAVIGHPPHDFSVFGEPTDAKIRAEMLEESLDIIVGLWSGEPFSYDGKHYHLNEVTFLPKPIQKPRIQYGLEEHGHSRHHISELQNGMV